MKRINAPLKMIDKILRDIRLKQVMHYIPDDGTILDIGCADGLLFELIGDRLKWGVGIDKQVKECRTPRYQLLSGYFPEDFADLKPGFDVIVMAAVLEHLPINRIPQVFSRCNQLLKPGGRLIITLPSRLTEPVLSLLVTSGLISGMDLDAHTGFHWKMLDSMLDPDEFELDLHRRFELGFNHLFVYFKQ